MRAEEERLAVRRRLEARVEIPDRRADLGSASVLVDLEAAIPEEPRHAVGDLPLLAGRARHRSQLHEQRDDVVLGHAPILGLTTRS